MNLSDREQEIYLQGQVDLMYQLSVKSLNIAVLNITSIGYNPFVEFVNYCTKVSKSINAEARKLKCKGAIKDE
jgi:hypothetical protein